MNQLPAVFKVVQKCKCSYICYLENGDMFHVTEFKGVWRKGSRRSIHTLFVAIVVFFLRNTSKRNRASVAVHVTDGMV
jgi:hypothetical protein